MYFLTKKLSLKLDIIAIKPKYKRQLYYKKCVTQKTLESKHYTQKIIT